MRTVKVTRLPQVQIEFKTEFVQRRKKGYSLKEGIVPLRGGDPALGHLSYRAPGLFLKEIYLKSNDALPSTLPKKESAVKNPEMRRQSSSVQILKMLRQRGLLERVDLGKRLQHGQGCKSRFCSECANRRSVDQMLDRQLREDEYMRHFPKLAKLVKSRVNP